MWTITAQSQTQQASQSTSFYRILTGKRYQVGRRKADSHICLADETISKAHAQLFVNNEYDLEDISLPPTFFVRDLKSTCGTAVQGKKLKPHVDTEATTEANLLFGKKICYRVVYEPLIISISSELDDGDTELSTSCARSLGAHVLPMNSADAILNKESSVFMSPSVIHKVSYALLSALIYQCPVVTVKYLTTFVRSIEEKAPPPGTSSYLPQLSHLLSKYFKLDASNDTRRRLFIGRHFFIYSKVISQQAKLLSNLIELAGGLAKIVTTDIDLSVSTESSVIFVSLESPIAHATKRLLADKKLRVIAPCEVLMAVACASMTEYANPTTSKPQFCFVHDDECDNECMLFSNACANIEESISHSVMELEHDDSASTISDGNVSTEHVVDHESTCMNIKDEPIFTSTQRNMCSEKAPTTALLPGEGNFRRGRDLVGGCSFSSSLQPKPRVTSANNSSYKQSDTLANTRRRPLDKSQLLIDDECITSNSIEKRRKVNSADEEFSRPSCITNVHNFSQQSEQSRLASPSIAPGAWISARKCSSRALADAREVSRVSRPVSIKEELSDSVDNPSQSLVVIKYTDDLFDPNCSISNMSEMRSALNASSVQPSPQLSFAETSCISAATTRRTQLPFANQKIFKKVWPLYMVSNEQRIANDQLVPAATIEKCRRNNMSTLEDSNNESVLTNKTQDNNGSHSGEHLQEDAAYSQRQQVFRNFFR